MPEDKIVTISTEKELQDHYRWNIEDYGYKIALVEPTGKYKSPFPDFWSVTEDFIVYRTEIEVYLGNFFLHKHDPSFVDKVYYVDNNLLLYGLQWLDEHVELIKMENIKIEGYTYKVRNRERLVKMLEKPKSSYWGYILNWFVVPGQGQCCICRRPLVVNHEGRIHPRKSVEIHKKCMKRLLWRVETYVRDPDDKELRREAIVDYKGREW